MEDAAHKDELLRWDNRTDTGYELIAGSPVAMTPP